MMLAHQGGWDEVLFALTPLVVVAILLLIANKRANAAKAAADLTKPGNPKKSAGRKESGETGKN